MELQKSKRESFSLEFPFFSVSDDYYFFNIILARFQSWSSPFPWEQRSCEVQLLICRNSVSQPLVMPTMQLKAWVGPTNPVHVVYVENWLYKAQTRSKPPIFIFFLTRWKKSYQRNMNIIKKVRKKKKKRSREGTQKGHLGVSPPLKLHQTAMNCTAAPN